MKKLTVSNLVLAIAGAVSVPSIYADNTVAQAAGGDASATGSTTVINGTNGVRIGLGLNMGTKQPPGLPNNLPKSCLTEVGSASKSYFAGIFYDNARAVVNVNPQCQADLDRLAQQGMKCDNVGAAMDGAEKVLAMRPDANKNGLISAINYHSWLKGCFNTENIVKPINLDVPEGQRLTLTGGLEKIPVPAQVQAPTLTPITVPVAPFVSAPVPSPAIRVPRPPQINIGPTIDCGARVSVWGKGANASVKSNARAAQKSLQALGCGIK